ncbi:mitochondria-eating protein isoform X1 [Gouania willdenowi]|uniref:mitochondria-eating protein isoform X1 n=1 Tax=Gouania willdenowi TaxID=441366 RepID=UPI001055229F|nr:mitochondria-eating protein isoform X1 [Gouania willdenowi]
MADNLSRLTNTSSFSLLQDKLESWHRDYHINSCEQNLNQCCELIELTAKIQGQLFTILNLTAAEGGQYAGVDTLKNRLLPWLGSCFSMARPSVTDDTSLQLIQDSVEKDRQIRELSFTHERDMKDVETQLCSTRIQLESVRAELADTRNELDESRSKSVATLLTHEDEILQLKADLRFANEELGVYKMKLNAADDYERRIDLLRESYLTREQRCSHTELPCLYTTHQHPTLSYKSGGLLPTRLGRSRSPSPKRNESPTRAQLTNSSRHARLVSRFSDLYAVERLDAQTLLRRYISDLETVQKIIFIATVESFKTAKLAYRQFKQRVKNTLSVSHDGPEGLEAAAVDYIVRNLDLYDVQASVNNVINAMNVNPRISFPPEVDFVLISALIRETCLVAFAMQTLDPPLDLAFASDAELFSDSKYRRSCDSEFTAPLVIHYVWPALVQGTTVIVKGEAVTRRWSKSQTRSRSVSPVRSRSLSPTRSLAFKNKRSLSPERLRASHL